MCGGDPFEVKHDIAMQDAVQCGRWHALWSLQCPSRNVHAVWHWWCMEADDIGGAGGACGAMEHPLEQCHTIIEP